MSQYHICVVVEAFRVFVRGLLVFFVRFCLHNPTAIDNWSSDKFMTQLIFTLEQSLRGFFFDTSQRVFSFFLLQAKKLSRLFIL